MGLIFTGLMILLFLGNLRATTATFLSIPLSTFGAFIVLGFLGQSINVMVLAGLALAFSRLIDNSVVVLENIFRHMEKGAPEGEAALAGAAEVALPVLAETVSTCIVFFPVALFQGVSRYLFGALGLTVVLSLLVSYVVAMTVVPVFCSIFLKRRRPGGHRRTGHIFAVCSRFHTGFSTLFGRLAGWIDILETGALRRPWTVICGILALTAASLLLAPAVGVAFFPRTDAGQFLINVKAPAGTRLELTADYIAASRQSSARRFSRRISILLCQTSERRRISLPFIPPIRPPTPQQCRSASRPTARRIQTS